MIDSKKNFSRNVQAIMALKDMTGRDVAHKTGISTNTIYAIKNGKNKMIKFCIVDAIADALNVSPAILFEPDLIKLIRDTKKEPAELTTSSMGKRK